LYREANRNLLEKCPEVIEGGMYAYHFAIKELRWKECKIFMNKKPNTNG
jgi:hypothetical protein